MSEAARALLHRTQMAARAAWQQTNLKGRLSGNPAARRDLEENWRPRWDPTAYIADVDPDPVDEEVMP